MAFRAVGLVRQRTDSTHVLAAVRDLTCLNLVTEVMRHALEEPPAGRRTGWSAS
ncbi:hypothetical protein [Streptomyces sp. NPDC086787]|uniref:hypothetical protein n=1 Tax=Streptomyces sp. NPDC086787 TaxID=3365759 RepID=UPI0038069AF2